MMELGGAEIAGIKMHAAIDVIYRRTISITVTMGIWLRLGSPGYPYYPEPAP